MIASYSDMRAAHEDRLAQINIKHMRSGDHARGPQMGFALIDAATHKGANAKLSTRVIAAARNMQ